MKPSSLQVATAYVVCRQVDMSPYFPFRSKESVDSIGITAHFESCLSVGVTQLFEGGDLSARSQGGVASGANAHF